MGRTLEQVLEQKGFADRFIAKGEARGRVEGRVEGEARGRVEGEARGRVEGKVEGKRDTIVAILRRRFKRVPKALETAIRQFNDPVVLESFAVESAVCNSLADFEKELK